MKNPNRNRHALLIAAALNLCIFVFGASAADKTWSGGGGDDNWNTGANWGGTAPVNADNLIFSGAVQQNNTNNISSLTVGWIQFASGGFTLNGNAFTLNPTPAGIITNLAGVNTIANDLIITPAAKTWNIAANSEVRLTGVVSNTSASGASAGWLLLTNGGTVRIMNAARSARGMDLLSGTVIVDGGLVDASNDGFRLKPQAGQTVAVQITNNGTLRIGGGGNFRMGHNGTAAGPAGQAGGIVNATISSGTLELYGVQVDVLVGDLVGGIAATFNQNGGLVWGSAGAGNALNIGNSANADGTYNLNGGTLWIAQVLQGNAGATNAVFNFNGGTLKPTGSSTTFMQGLLSANVQSGGAIIDTTNFNITIGQSLQAAGGGGLTKLGSGTLTLTGGNTYTGATIISNGTLATSSSSFSGGGAITVTSNANLGVTYNGSSVSASTLTVGSSVTNTLTLDLGASPSPGGSPVFAVGTLTGSGPALINITGSSFAPGTYPLIAFTTGTGLSSIKLGTLPLGLSGTLVQAGNTLNLVVTVAPKNLAWSGASNGNWDTATLNWFDLNNGNNPTNYAQSGSIGDAVTFDDSVGGGVTTVSIAVTVTPASVTANNNVNYTLTGAGKISGATSLVKAGTGFGTLSIGTTNDYTGGTTINAGNVYVGNNSALGQGAVTINLGTLASDSTTARTLTNAIVQNANVGVILGDTANTGTLTLAGKLDLGGGATRTLLFNSDVVVTGSLTNGGFTTKTGLGRMIIQGNSQQSGLVAQQQGDVIIDGAQFTNNDGWRLQNTLPSSTLRLIITNGGVFNAAVGGNTGNLRAGLTAGDNSADNVLDISGTLNVAPQSAAVAGNNAVILGQSGANAILNLRSGGLLITRALFGNAPANSEVHFMGGTMRAIANDTAFIQGMTNAFMETGGLTIDTTNFTVTVPQSLLASGSGGLTKSGTGTLTLTGANTYSGTTVVSAGKLILGPAHAATGGITVNANSTLAFLQSSPPATVNVSSVTIGSGANSALEAQLSATNAAAAVITNLVLNGSVAVNVSGLLGVGQIPLFGYGTISGSGNLTLGVVPQGTVGSLVTNTPNKTIDLLVSSIAQVIWTGATNGNWDTTTTNWTVSGSPAAFSQNANVLFRDSASNSSVTLTTALTPSTMVVSNTGLSYTFSGAGSLGGNMTLVKDGTNTATLSAANTYTGTTTVKSGKLATGSATALGADSAGTTVQNGATLDVLGSNLGLEPVVLAGNGTGGAGALNNTGGDQNNALRDVTLTANTTIRTDALLGIRTSPDTDPGFKGNGFKLTKTGSNQLNFNGGQTTVGTNIWDSDLGDVDILEGTLSFQRRMTMGRVTNAVHVAPGATILLFALDTNMVVQTKPVHLTNATLSANGNIAAEGSTFAGSVTLTGSSNFISALTGVTLTQNGVISGSGSYASSGSIILGGVNTYTGGTTITIGTLQLSGTGSIANSASIHVSAGATLDVAAVAPWTLGTSQTLSGLGTINGSVQANGTVSPGASIGALAFNNDLTLVGTNVMELTKDGGLTNDVITVNGTLIYGGRLNVVLTGSTPLAVNDTFKLYNFVSAPTGSFTSSLPTGYTWDPTQLAVDGTIRVTGVSSVPSFGAVTVSGSTLTLTGSGGSPSGTYHIVSATNVTLPMASWTPVLTNTFAANGNFTNALPISLSEPQRFYRLRLP